MDRNDHNNRSNMMNPNNVGYWKSRGFQNRPDDWQNQINKSTVQNSSDHTSIASQKNPAKGIGNRFNWEWICLRCGDCNDK